MINVAVGIMILGSAGSGKTTLGRLAAQELEFIFVDIDEYIWRQDTDKPFTVMYSKEEKISRLMEAIAQTEHFVMAGSMNSFHEHFDPFFQLVVHLNADTNLRIERIHKRELALLGNRILEGGDMYEKHQQFLEDVAGYDLGIGGVTLQNHQAWIDTLKCKVIHLDGGDPLEQNLNAIIQEYKRQMME